MGARQVLAAGAVAVTGMVAIGEQMVAMAVDSGNGGEIPIDPNNIDDARKELGYTEKQIQHCERQYAQHGRASLERSRRTVLRRIKEHLKKLDEIREAGGNTSSIEREIRNWMQELNAIDEVLRRH